MTSHLKKILGRLLLVILVVGAANSSTSYPVLFTAWYGLRGLI